MTNRIQQTLQQKNLLSIYFTASYPHVNSTRVMMKSLQDAGVNMIELGIPFSDPVADGAVIQAANTVAIENGFSMHLLLKQLADFRKEISIPVIIMSYLNPIHQYGIEKFVNDFAGVGIDGVIIPDLPIDFFKENYQALFKEKKMAFIPLMVPQTHEKRIEEINEVADSFIYLLSSSSTTGKQLTKDHSSLPSFLTTYEKYLTRPLMIGFGIRTHEDFSYVCKYAHGAIIGSHFVASLEHTKNETIGHHCMSFVKGILNGK